MRKSRGIYIDKRKGRRPYVFIRIWPLGKPNRPFLQCFGPLTRDNLEIAEFKLREYRNQIKLGTFGIPETLKPIGIEDACALYYKRHGSQLGSAKDCKRILDRLTEQWRGRTLDSITFEDVKRYRAWRKGLGDAESTINRQHVVITSLFSRLKDWVKTNEIEHVKLPEDNPGSLVSKSNEADSVRRRALTVEEFERLLARATSRGHDIYVLAVNSLLRKKDLMNLRKESINESTGEIHGLQSKTGRPYSVVITEPIAEILAKVESGLVLDFRNFQTEFNRARSAAKIKDFEFRDLRRTGATRMLKDGADLVTVSQMLGHSSIQMTERYIGTVREDRKRAAELLAQRFRSRKSDFSSDVNSDVKQLVSSMVETENRVDL
jgi:integrase